MSSSNAGGEASGEASSAAAALCDHVQRAGLGSHLFSDITLCFQNKEYKLHRIILSQSSYFRSLFSGPWKECGKPRVELHIDDSNVTVFGVEASIGYMYGVTPTFTGDSVVGVLAAGCFLCMENLCEQCVRFMVQDLREETFVTYQHLSEHHCYGHFADRIRDACWTFLCSHGARELLHVLPKLSLQLLCRLLKSDELWVLNESERYKLAKQALLSWKQARNPAYEGMSAKKSKSSKASSGRKSSSRGCGGQTPGKLKEYQRRHKSKKRDAEQKAAHQKEEVAESPLRRLQKLWEEDSGEHSDTKEGFNMVVDLLTGGGVIFAYMDADEALQARRELEDANLPTDAVNDAIWQNVLLKARIKDGEHPFKSSSSEEEEEEMEEDEEDEEDEEVDGEEEEEEEEEHEAESSESEEDSWDSESNSSQDEEELRAPAAVASASSSAPKRANTTLVGFCNSEAAPFDGKRRKTTGGFSWAAKLDSGMQLADFPPFRFGAEFAFKEKPWISECCVTSSDYVFYGGSAWRIYVRRSDCGWLMSVQCRRLDGLTFEGVAYEDNRKKVLYTAKLFVKTKSGLQSVSGMGQRMRKYAEQRLSVGMPLPLEELTKEKPLRVAAVVQLL